MQALLLFIMATSFKISFSSAILNTIQEMVLLVVHYPIAIFYIIG